MCYQNCEYENHHGDCTKTKPTGWICPPDREECTECRGIFDGSDLEDGLCESCLAEKSKVRRYAFVSIPGGFREHESDTGEWVRFEDVQAILADKREQEYQAIEILGNNKMFKRQAI